MFTLILGPNGSGKSAYAEGIIRKLSGTKRYYIATMIPYGEEGKARVEKHLTMRRDLQMETIEDPYLEHIDKVEAGSDVLLEDVSNLVANTLFEKGKEACDEILNKILSLHNKAENLIVVSIGGIEEDGYDEETMLYIRKLNEMNEALQKIANQTVKMGENL